jgi:glycosyltransferase involved in cell wall biosynthesis
MHKACVLKADSLGEMSGAFFENGLARFGLRLTSRSVRLFLWLRNQVLRHAHGFVAVSSEVRAELIANGVDRSLIREIPNSVDTREFLPADTQRKRDFRQQLDLPLHAPIVIYTGRLVTYKGLPLLLRVWEALHRQHDQAVLLLVGSGSLDMHNCEDELKKFVRTKALSQSVRFTGPVDNVHEFLQASDIFVLPTENEAFGISLVEAMACGLAVVSTRVGGIREILTHMSDGIIVRAGDSQQLRDALDRLLSNPELSARLGRAARATAQERYSAPGLTERYIKLFSSVHNLG